MNDPANRSETGKFHKGKSGNPSGRPKKTKQELDLIAACKEKTPQALSTLVEIMEYGAERNRITAAIAIIERGYGKAVQPADVDIRADVAGRIEIVIVDHKG